MVAMREHLNEKVRRGTKQVNIELGTLRMERDERDVQMILTCLKNWTPNMWHPNQPISNIATGKIASEAMTRNTLSLKERGKEAMREFIGRFTLSAENAFIECGTLL